MSGGYFNYDQYRLDEIADSIELLIVDNENNYQESFSDDTIAKFKYAVKIIREGSAYVHRIDYLVSNDDGEEEFHKRLADDLKGLT